MKKFFFVVIFVLLMAGLLFLSWLYFSKKEDAKNVSSNIVAAEYPTKIVYNMSAGDELIFMADCKKRAGAFDNCGSSCEDSASFCAAVCVPVCEFERLVIYKNDVLGFEIKYPENLMQIDANEADTVKFILQGELQKVGKEFLDGLMLSVVRGPKKATLSLENFVKEQRDGYISAGTIVSDLRAIEINKQKGFTYSEKTMTHFYFENNDDIYQVLYMAPDPRNQGYAALAERMLQSFLIKK